MDDWNPNSPVALRNPIQGSLAFSLSLRVAVPSAQGEMEGYHAGEGTATRS